MNTFKKNLYSLVIIFGGLLLASVTASIVSASKGTELMKLKSDILAEKELNRDLSQQIANKSSLTQIREEVKLKMVEPDIDKIEYLHNDQ